MSDPLAEQILECIYHNTEVRRKSKDALSDWILDTQPRTAPLDAAALVRYLVTSQPHLFEHLKVNVRLQEDLALAEMVIE